MIATPRRSTRNGTPLPYTTRCRSLAEGDAASRAAARTTDPQVLSTTALDALTPARRARVLRRWIETLRLPPLPAQGIARIAADLLAAAAATAAVFEWPGARVGRWRDQIGSAQCRERVWPYWSTQACAVRCQKKNKTE